GPPRADLAWAIAEVATGSYIRGMRAVGIKALKDRLSEYVRIAAGGETVLVTDRDEVVAELGPPRAGRAAAIGDALLAEAVRQGWVTPPSIVGQGEPPHLPVAPWAALAAGLDQDRADR
ncbi:MAG: type II toxin-antitoxin system Phd/YefM family antitoxin, partial [Rhodospirillales bacterium]|nr:type II toxin-antitoxin system Phd/YefM family antitoxin [Rhodospirillales bacterium]